MPVSYTQRRAACTNTHPGLVSPLSHLRARTGPQIPRVRLHYEAQDQEQERAAYFRKRVAPLLLQHAHVHIAQDVFNVVPTHDNVHVY